MLCSYAKMFFCFYLCSACFQIQKQQNGVFPNHRDPVHHIHWIKNPFHTLIVLLSNKCNAKDKIMTAPVVQHLNSQQLWGWSAVKIVSEWQRLKEPLAMVHCFWSGPQPHTHTHTHTNTSACPTVRFWKSAAVSAIWAPTCSQMSSL